MRFIKTVQVLSLVSAAFLSKGCVCLADDELAGLNEAEQQGRDALQAAQPDRAEKFLGQAVNIQERAGRHDVSLVKDLLNLANACSQEGKYEQAKTSCQKAIAVLKMISSPPADLQAKPHITLATVYTALGKYGDANPEATEACTILEKNYGAKSPFLVDALNIQADVLGWQAKYEQSEATVQRALDIIGQSQSNSPQAAPLLQKLAVLYGVRGNWQKAEPALKQALGIYEKEVPRRPKYIASVLVGLGTCYEHDGRWNDAEAVVKKAIDIVTEDKENAHSIGDQRQLLWAFLILSGIYNAQGNHAQAEEEAKKAKAIAETVYPSGHPINAIVLNKLAAIYISEGKYALAEDIYRQVLSISQAAADAVKQPTSGPFQLGLTADVAVDLASSHSAEDLSTLDQALSLSKKGFGSGHPVVADALTNLGLVCLLQKKYSDSLNYYQKALDIRKTIFGPKSRQAAASLISIGAVLVLQKQYEQAEPIYKQALDILKDSEGGEQQPGVVGCLTALGRIYRQENDLKQAEQILRKALVVCNEPPIVHAKVDAADILNQASEAVSAEEQAQDGTVAVAMRATALSLGTDSPLGKESTQTASVMLSLAEILSQEGQYKEAESMAKEAISIKQKHFGPDNIQVAQALTVCAAILQQEKKLPEAQSLLEQAATVYEKKLGDNSTIYAGTLKKLSRVAYLQGKYDESKQFQAQAASIESTRAQSSASAGKTTKPE